jgi:hypothetical protein
MDDDGPERAREFDANDRNLEVVVFRRGAEIHREVCESLDEAASIVDYWNEQDGIECRVDDLAVHHGPGDILESTDDELLAAPGDDYRPVED